jgi:hypothetical protein
MSESTFNLSDLLAGDLDALPDVPAFVTWPAGAYRCTVTGKMDEINDQPVYKVDYSLKEVLQLANDTDVAPMLGSTNGEAFNLGKTFGVGKLKEFLLPFAKKFGVSKVDELMSMIINVEVDVVNKPRKDKNDKERSYFSSIAIEIV